MTKVNINLPLLRRLVLYQFKSVCLADDGAEREITIFLTGVSCKTVALNVHLNCTVDKIKSDIAKQFLVPVQQQSLWNEGVELKAGSLWNYRITNFAHIELLVKVKGGAPMVSFSDLREEARWEYFESTEERLNQIRSVMHIPTYFTSRRSFEELTLEKQADVMISVQRNLIDLLEVLEKKRRVAEREDNGMLPQLLITVNIFSDIALFLTFQSGFGGQN